MGIFGKLFGKKNNRAIVEEGGMIVFRRRELAELMKRPKEPNGSADAPEPSPSRGRCANSSGVLDYGHDSTKSRTPRLDGARQ